RLAVSPAVLGRARRVVEGPAAGARAGRPARLPAPRRPQRRPCLENPRQPPRDRADRSLRRESGRRMAAARGQTAPRYPAPGHRPREAPGAFRFRRWRRCAATDQAAFWLLTGSGRPPPTAILRGLAASGTSRARSTCSMPLTRLAPTTLM